MNKRNNTGVSETIGFILILGIVISGIGVVTLYGYPALLQQQENANIKNMEKNMIVLQNDVKLLAYKTVPYRETSMQITGGYLQVIPPNPTDPTLPGQSNFIITAWNGSNSLPYGTYYTGLLQFNSTSTNEIIALQNGAVVTNGFSDIGSGSTMLSEPRWYLDTDLSGKRTLVIQIININSNGVVSTSNGIGTVQMSITSEDPIEVLPGWTKVVIEYYDNGEGYERAWWNYFNNQQVFPSGLVSSSPTTLTLNNIDRTVIKVYNVTVLNL
jgi:hypothetical protein